MTKIIQLSNLCIEEVVYLLTEKGVFKEMKFLLCIILITAGIFYLFPVFIPQHCTIVSIYAKDVDYCKLDLIPNCKKSDNGFIDIKNAEVKMDINHKFQIVSFFNHEKKEYVKLPIRVDQPDQFVSCVTITDKKEGI